MSIEIFLAIAGMMLGSGVIASIVTGVFARKKIASETKHTIAEAESITVATMRQVIERLDAELQATRQELATTRRQLKETQQQLIEVTKQLEEFLN